MTQPAAAQVDISPEAVERMAYFTQMAGNDKPADMLRALRSALTESKADYERIYAALIAEQEHVLMMQSSATAREKRVAELVAKYETDNPIKPTAAELQDWLDGECAKAVKSYRTRLNCGLRQAVDAMKEATP